MQAYTLSLNGVPDRLLAETLRPFVRSFIRSSIRGSARLPACPSVRSFVRSFIDGRDDAMNKTPKGVAPFSRTAAGAAPAVVVVVAIGANVRVFTRFHSSVRVSIACPGVKTFPPEDRFRVSNSSSFSLSFLAVTTLMSSRS